MGDVIKFKKIPTNNLVHRPKKVTLTSLALAMEYYTRIVPDPEFVTKARADLFRHNTDLVCEVSEEIYLKVTKDMPAKEAVDKLLFG